MQATWSDESESITLCDDRSHIEYPEYELCAHMDTLEDLSGGTETYRCLPLLSASLQIKDATGITYYAGERSLRGLLLKQTTCGLYRRVGHFRCWTNTDTWFDQQEPQTITLI